MVQISDVNVYDVFLILVLHNDLKVVYDHDVKGYIKVHIKVSPIILYD